MKTYEDDINMYFELKGYPEQTRKSYFIRINAFLKFFRDQQKNPEEITLSDIQQYILYLKKIKGLSPGTINNYVSGIKFFYTHVLGKEWDSKKVPRMRRVYKMPVIPSRDEILNMLYAVENLKHKAILFLIYGSGLRVSEVVKLRIGDICSKTMRIRVEGAKHNTDRYTILSESALLVLRQYFRQYFSGKHYELDDWLFPGQSKGMPVNVKTIKNTVIKLRNRLRMNQNISAHTMRHCFATHAMENGVDPLFIQQLLGHKNLKTTLTYLHMTSKSLMGIKSPLDVKRSEDK